MDHLLNFLVECCHKKINRKSVAKREGLSTSKNNLISFTIMSQLNYSKCRQVTMTLTNSN